MIEVTETKVFRVKNPREGSPLKAFAQVTLNEEFVVKSIRVIEGKNGLFIGFPQTQGQDDNYYDICFPITKETRETISNAIINAYNGNDDDAVPAGDAGEDDSGWGD